MGQSFLFRETAELVVAAILLTILLSVLSYELVERPFWKGAFSGSSPHHVLSASVAAVIPAVALTVLILQELNPFEWDAPSAFVEARMDTPSLYARNCDQWYESFEVVPCDYGIPGEGNHLIYIGDSVGVQWFSAVRQAFVEEGWYLTVFTKSACPIVDSPIYYDLLKDTYHVCEEWRGRVIEEVAELRPSLVIVGSSSRYSYSAREWVEGSREVFSQLAETAGAVLVLPGPPGLPFDGPSCVDKELAKWGMVPNGNCSSSDGIAQAMRVEKHLRQAASGLANVSVVQVMDLVCPEGMCHAMDHTGFLVYRDDLHLTDSFVLKVADRFGGRLKRHSRALGNSTN